MFQKILVPVDGSNTSWKALETYDPINNANNSVAQLALAGYLYS